MTTLFNVHYQFTVFPHDYYQFVRESIFANGAGNMNSQIDNSTWNSAGHKANVGMVATLSTAVSHDTHWPKYNQ